MLHIDERGIFAYHSNEQQYNAYIVLEDGTQVTKDIAELTINYVTGNKLIGNIGVKTAEIKLFNASKYGITDKTFTIYAVFKTPENSSNAYNKTFKLGTFKVVEALEKNIKKDEIKVKAKDFTYKFMDTYKIPKTEYPMTINQLITRIGRDKGFNVSIKTGTQNLNYTIQNQIYYKDDLLISLLKEIGEATATNVYVDNENNLVFKPINKTHNLELLDKDIFELTTTDISTGIYNVVTASRIQNSDTSTTEDVFYPTTLPENKNEYKIIFNNLIDDNREGALQGILDGIKDIDLKGVNCEIKLPLFIEPFDTLYVNGKEKAKFIVNDMVFNLNTGTAKLDTKILTKTQTDYKAASRTERVKQTEIKVNRALGEITSIIEKQQDNYNYIIETRNSINGIENKFSQVNTEIENAKANIVNVSQTIDGVKTELQSAGQDNLIYDSAFYSFANGNKQYSEYYTMAYIDENNTIIMPTWDDITNYMKSKGITAFRGGGTEDRRNQLLEDFPNVKRVEYSNNKWYARNNTTTSNKLEPIIVENSESKHGIVMKNNQVLQNFYINDANSKYSLSYKLRKTNGVGRVYTRIRNLSKGEQAIDFMSDSRIVHNKDNGIINLHVSANNTFGGSSAGNNMTSFWTKVVSSKVAKTILIPAGTYTIKGNIWRSGINRRLEFAYYLQSDLSTRKTTGWNAPNGVVSKVITINEPFYFDSIAWLDLSKTESFSYTIENLRMEIGDTSAIGAVATTAFKDFPAGITVNEFTEFKFEDLQLKEGINQFEIVTDNGSEAEMTDIILTKTPKSIKWSPAVGETRNTNVNIGIEGISVHSVNTNNLTEMTPHGFNGYSILNGKKEKMFGLSGDETFTKNLIASNEFRMPPFRLISITDGPKKGWALVKD